MNDLEFLTLISDLVDEGLSRCLSYKAKHKRPACMEEDLKKIRNEVSLRLRDCKDYPTTLTDLINQDRREEMIRKLSFLFPRG